MSSIGRVKWSKDGSVSIYDDTREACQDGKFICKLDDRRDVEFFTAMILTALKKVSEHQRERNATQKREVLENQEREHQGDDRRGPSASSGGSGGVPPAEEVNGEAEEIEPAPI